MMNFIGFALLAYKNSHVLVGVGKIELGHLLGLELSHLLGLELHEFGIASVGGKDAGRCHIIGNLIESYFHGLVVKGICRKGRALQCVLRSHNCPGTGRLFDNFCSF